MRRVVGGKVDGRRGVVEAEQLPRRGGGDGGGPGGGGDGGGGIGGGGDGEERPQTAPAYYGGGGEGDGDEVGDDGD